MEQEEKSYIVEKIMSIEEYENERKVKIGKIFYPIALSLEGAIVSIDGVSGLRCINMGLLLLFLNIYEANRRDSKVLKSILEINLDVSKLKQEDEKKYLEDVYNNFSKNQNKTLIKLLINLFSLGAIFASYAFVSSKCDNLSVSIPALFGALTGFLVARLVKNMNNHNANNLIMDSVLFKEDMLTRKREI